MAAPLYNIPGSTQAASAAAVPDTVPKARTVNEVLAQSQVESVMDELERDLVGLAPVKQRIRDIAALLVVDKLRLNLGLAAGPAGSGPSLHMSFTGNPGTGKTTVAMRMAEILHRLGYVRKGHLVAVTRDDLVGQYIGHTAPKTKEVLKKAMGGVLFIDEAYYLNRPENERDYGQEAIEILLQVMEDQRNDLVVILAGYKDRMDTFFKSNPGLSSRIAHHIDFPDYAQCELLQISERMLQGMNYRFGAGAREAFEEYLGLRLQQAHFANARSVRNALDRARLRQASRLFADRDRVLSAEDLTTLLPSDIRASRVFQAATLKSIRQTDPGDPMPLSNRWTLTRYLIEERRRFPTTSGDLNALVLDVSLACKAIARIVAFGSLGDSLGAVALPQAGGTNVQGEVQKPLDVLSNEIFIRMNEWNGHLAGMASEETDEPRQIPGAYPRGKYLLVFDPLDGSSNIDVNVSVGSIFSILRAPQEVVDSGRDVTEADFLQPGATQVAAGYALYGPVTMLVLTVGNGVAGFTLNPNLGEFVLSHPNIQVPADTTEFAINSSNARFWEPPVKRYVDECLAGKTGPRGRDFNMRWIASMVAEAHRILMRGGVFMYPRDTKDPAKPGRLRLLYEANPIGMVMEQAGGRASTGRQPVLGLKPSALHQRIGLVFGSKNEVERIERYHHDPATRDSGTPLFAERSLFRD